MINDSLVSDKIEPKVVESSKSTSEDLDSELREECLDDGSVPLQTAA